MMNTSLFYPAAAVCAALILLIARHLFIRPAPLPELDEKKSPLPSPAPCDVEKGETPPPTPAHFVSDIKADIVEDVWPAHELRQSDEVVPTLDSLPNVPLVWGMDYSFDARPAMSAIDRRPLMAYSHIASALGVDEPEPVVRARSSSATVTAVGSSMSTATDTRPMVSRSRVLHAHRADPSLLQRSRSLISGIVSDWNSLSQSEQQAWATLSEARASRTRSAHVPSHVSVCLASSFGPRVDDVFH